MIMLLKGSVARRVQLQAGPMRALVEVDCMTQRDLPLPESRCGPCNSLLETAEAALGIARQWGEQGVRNIAITTPKGESLDLDRFGMMVRTKEPRSDTGNRASQRLRTRSCCAPRPPRSEPVIGTARYPGALAVIHPPLTAELKKGFTVTRGAGVCGEHQS